MTTVDRWNLDSANAIADAYAAPSIRAADVIMPAEDRDLRLDLICGIANWFIFIDHIPENVANWITIRNFGFSGAAEWFVFISGYTAAIVFARIMLERGFIVGATRVFSRVWQLYTAYLVLFVIYLATIGYVATEYFAPDILNEFNVAGLIDHPIRTLAFGLKLQSRTLNLDILQLYIALMAAFPAVLWLMLRKPDVALIGSLTLYVVARWNEWNLPSFPEGSWYFNPFCWQLLFVIGAWLALGGARQYRPVLKRPVLLYAGIAVLVFALAMTMAGRFPEFGNMLPQWLFDAFIPNDKANLAPYRVLHFAVLAFFMERFLPRDWRGLQWRIFQPAIICGQQSLAVFCVGVFLSFVAHFVLIVNLRSVLLQIAVSAAGITIMTLVAYYITWSARLDAKN
jgi:hypothetical protein